jgi:hypothetical protein
MYKQGSEGESHINNDSGTWALSQMQSTVGTEVGRTSFLITTPKIYECLLHAKPFACLRSHRYLHRKVSLGSCSRLGKLSSKKGHFKYNRIFKALHKPREFSEQSRSWDGCSLCCMRSWDGTRGCKVSVGTEKTRILSYSP